MKFRAEMERPAGPRPVHFPVNQSFTLAATHNFFTLPEAVGRTLKRTTPEEIAQYGRQLGTTISPLALWMFGYHFLVGREILIDLGELKPRARVDNIALVLDFWRRVAFAHRGDGHLDNSEAGSTNPFLPATIIQQLYQALTPMDPGIRRRVSEFFSVLEEYLFLLNAEARLGFADSGPYPLNVERVLIVRDFFDLKGVHYPWHEVVADLPYCTCSLAFTLDPADFQSIELTDRSVLLTVPVAYSEAIREIALVSRDEGTLRVLPITEMDWLARAAKKAQPKLLEWFTRLSQHEWIICGAFPWVLRPFALAARTEDYSWELDARALRLLPLYEADEARAVRWATHRCLAPGKQSAFVSLA